MSTTTWQVSGHAVELTHGWWSGRTTLCVDGEVVFHRPAPVLFIDFGLAHRFQIDGTPCAVRVVSTGFTFRRELLTGKDAESVQEASHCFEISLLSLALFVIVMITPVIVAFAAVVWILWREELSFGLVLTISTLAITSNGIQSVM